jgi:hypothetical protein
MLRRLPLLTGLVLLTAGGTALGGLSAEKPAFATLGAEYSREVRPLLKQYCLGCHSKAKHAGELDLERFATLREVRQAPRAWVKVAEMLGNGEMPPKASKQPTSPQRNALRAWVKRYLDAEALAGAGDPGPVLLRRLNNAEYTYTVRDLTGVALDPAREFPADSAAGEGFTNTGSSLVMSPALLTKYFDAAKEIAKHAELLPDGFRFSDHTTRSDWTNDALAGIRALYARYTEAAGASTVNLQGIVFDTNTGGRLPLERYLTATLAEREALQSGKKTAGAVARERGLSPKYLGLLWSALNDREPSPLLDPLRAQWRARKSTDAAPLAAAIGAWQKALFRFSTVGQIGRAGGPKGWQEPVTPVAASQEVRLKLPAPQGDQLSLYLTTRGAGDGNAGDVVEWRRPRLVAPGKPEVLLRDLRDFTREMAAARAGLFASTARCLEAAAEADRGEVDLAALARKHEVDPESLAGWLEYLGIRSGAPPKLTHFSVPIKGASNYAFVNGWGSPDLPSLVTNSSGQHVRIPGNLKPHGVCVHPTPQLSACVGWQSPIAGALHVEGKVTHAHPECGNGVTWAVELRRGTTRRQLAAGVAQGGHAGPFSLAAPVRVQPGDLLSLVIGPRNADHSCDLTDLELTLKSQSPDPKEWTLTRDVADDILAGNPHADRYGTAGVWHFYSEPVAGAAPGPKVPDGSLLARWQEADSPAERRVLAGRLQKLLTTGPAGLEEKHPDAQLYRQLASLGGPLLARAWRRFDPAAVRPAGPTDERPAGPDPALFGKDPTGGKVDPASLCVRAPSVVEVRLPADLAAGTELVTTALLHPESAAGSVQAQVLTARPSDAPLVPDAPILVGESPASRERYERAFAEFRSLFPIALAYTKIVPVDEVVTLTLFYREDEPLRRLMLTEAEIRELDRLWAELRWVSQSPLKLVNAYEQIAEFATQDRPDLVEAFKPLKQPIYDAAAAFEKEMVAAEPRQVGRLVQFAERAYRRPLTAAEAAELRALYRRLRQEELPHEEAFRLTLARILVAPAFLYRLEAAPAGTATARISDWELASRMSYFLWSSMPDEKLRAAAAAGTLHRPEVLSAHLRRMLADPKMRRLATEFTCQWLHIYEFDTLDEKSEKLFPEFAALRQDMYEEAIRYFTDLFQRDAPAQELFDSDHTFVNERLAKFYGIPGVTGESWRRITGVRAAGRGGLLGLSATLAKQSGASRTSPILRGNWVSEVLLGERLPRPPKDVPRLPEDETTTEGMTVRQLVIRHTSDPRCSGCHRKIDPYGFALEGFDAIGRRRLQDLAGRAIDTKTRTPDGQAIDGLPGLRAYLLRTRREALLRQFCRKLLGYALGRAVQLSDEPLLTRMQQALAKPGCRFSTLMGMIILSRQFREIRGGAAAAEHTAHGRSIGDRHAADG